MTEKFSGCLKQVAVIKAENDHLRFGQVCFNVLYDLDPDFACTVLGTADDPFFDDSRVPEFLMKVRQFWMN
jgi:hypothetical protein